MSCGRGAATNAAGILWCNGLVPAFATAGLGHRIVHLHQEPVGVNAIAARVARRGALVTLVPSESMASPVPGSRVLWNWVEPVATRPRPSEHAEQRRVGFLGRHSVDKGLVTLAAGLAELDRHRPGPLPPAAGRRGAVRPAGGQRPASAEPCNRSSTSSSARAGSRARTSSPPSTSRSSPRSGPSRSGSWPPRRCPRAPRFVISDAGALAEVAGPEHPWVTPKGDAVALAAAVESVFDAGPDRMVEVLDRGYARWLEHFSPAAGLARLSALLDDLGL